MNKDESELKRMLMNRLPRDIDMNGTISELFPNPDTPWTYKAIYEKFEKLGGNGLI